MKTYFHIKQPKMGNYSDSLQYKGGEINHGMSKKWNSSSNKQQITDRCNNLDEPQRNYVN